MGMLIEGKWTAQRRAERNVAGAFVRADTRFRDWITADGSSGFKADKVAITFTSPPPARGPTGR